MTKLSIVTPSFRPNGLETIRESLLEQTFRDFEWLVDINATGSPDLNHADNRLLKRSSGEYVLFWQDYIKAGKSILQKVVDVMEDDKESGLKTAYTFPVGKTKSFDKLDIVWDWRSTSDGERGWQEWEIDFGCATRKDLIEAGGFDEELDGGWGFDNVNIGLRLHNNGVKIMCDSSVRVIALDHDALEEHPFRKLGDEALHNAQLDKIRRGEWRSTL